MSMKRALQVILGVGLGGLAFSGYLTFMELFAEQAPACSPIGQPGTMFGYPPCVYGFFMYLVIVGVAAFGLLNARNQRLAAGGQEHAPHHVPRRQQGRRPIDLKFGR